VLKNSKKIITEFDWGFYNEVAAFPGGEKIKECIQCGTCSGSCPTSYKWDYTPRRIFAMVKAGLKEEVLSSKSIWLCSSCYLCTIRCPQEINITDAMYALKRLSIKNNTYPKECTYPVLSKIFVNMINRIGRIDEAKLLTLYYLKTNIIRLFKILPLGLKLICKKRITIIPDMIHNKAQLKKIINRAKELIGE
jgi:heterodisulfide reductase subunit C